VVPGLTLFDAARGDAYRVRAERVRGEDGEPRGLVVIEPLDRTDRADTLLELGLTAREAQVALAVLRGERTAEIAAGLAISTYTVQDHVRHICEKVGVASRRALAALLLGTVSAALD
jgi:DNA-binding CsgD family transcriptional regulator